MKKIFMFILSAVFMMFPVSASAKSVPPDMELQGLNVESRTLRELYENAPLYLNFWATWCPPCVGEMPAIDSLSEKYTGRVIFAAVSVDSDSSLPVAFARERKMTVPVYTADPNEINSAFDFNAIPYSLLIDTNGNIIAEHLGAMSEDDLEAFINQGL